MFDSLVAQAKSAVTDTAERLLGRAAVALLMVVATGFATAALMIWLVEMWGAVRACLAIAALFAVVALITTVVISASERRPEAEAEAETAADEVSGESAGLVSGFTSMVASDPVTLFSAASTTVAIMRMLGRRTSLLLVALVAAAYVWVRLSEENGETSAASGPPPAPAE